MRFLKFVGCSLLVGAAFACSTGPTTSSEEDLTLAQLPVQLPVPVMGLFDQAIDHPRDGAMPPEAPLGTFKQRYWVSPGFATRPDSPVLFYLCGESACSQFYGTALADLARTLGAAVVLLEHRYYGTSKPFEQLTLENMKYLSIHNALEDAASFERFAREKHQLGGKWIAVGGSYAGMLAAFYREKHPELVAGAWASSAPVNMVKSFWGYDALSSRILGPTCSVMFRQALAAASEAYDDPAQRLAFLQSIFGPRVSGEISKVNVMRTLSGLALSGLQYGQTRRVCAALDQHAAHPLDGLIGMMHPPLVPDPLDLAADGGASEAGAGGAADGGASADAGMASGGGEPTSPLFDPILAIPPAGSDFSGYTWFYQVCTEVGFFQVHNPDRNESVMSELVDDDYYAEQCAAVAHAQPDVEKTRAEYYAPLLAGTVTNVLFTNGSKDPWSALSFTDPSALPAGLTSFVVQQGSHCEDLANLNQGSILGVFEAHVKVNALVKTWIAE